MREMSNAMENLALPRNLISPPNIRGNLTVFLSKILLAIKLFYFKDEVLKMRH